MHTEFINAMVKSMYQFESCMINQPNLMTREELADFYHAWCGGFCPLATI